MTGPAAPTDDLTDFAERYVAVWNERDRNSVRLVWPMFSPGDEHTPISIGTNLIVLDDRGRIAADHRFLDR